MLNYIKGANKERRVVNKARKAGKIAWRSAGSHSPIDVCIIDREAKTVRFIQCKPKNFSKNKKEGLLEKYKFLNDEYLCSFQVL